MARPGPTGQQFSYAQLEGLWISQGGPPRLAPVMAAIAMAESGGQSAAHNPSGASGLWQILGNPFPGNPFDPATNARMAVAKWRTQGLGAWVTYTSGAYQTYLKRGVQPVTPGGVSNAPPGSPYRNPFRGVRGLTAERVDMGVDYAGTGDVYALGPGRITAVNKSWAGGYGTGPGWWITERLSTGPLAGKQVYLSEHVTPEVKPGQKVTANTVIGRMFGGIETGIAAPGASGQAGTTLAAQLGEIPSSGDPGAQPTLAGAAYSKVLRWSGAPAGVIPPGVQPVGGSAVGGGGAPSWLEKLWDITGIGAAQDVGQRAGGIAGAIGNVASTLSGIAAAIDWLFHPENWVRIIAGVGGGALVIGGVVVLSHAGEGLRGPLTSRPAALPVGILMVGSGGVLLFVAFHNLEAPPGTSSPIGETLGQLRDQLQATSAGQQAA